MDVHVNSHHFMLCFVIKLCHKQKLLTEVHLISLIYFALVEKYIKVKL